MSARGESAAAARACVTRCRCKRLLDRLLMSVAVEKARVCCGFRASLGVPWYGWLKLVEPREISTRNACKVLV